MDRSVNGEGSDAGLGVRRVVTASGQYGIDGVQHRLAKRHATVQARADVCQVAPSRVLHVRPVLEIARVLRRLTVHDPRQRR